MAGKFIELKDAAKQLGIKPERLLEMRESGEAHGYRDGASWKFKPEEIERIAGELNAGDAGDDADLSFSDSAALSGDDFDSLLDVNVDLDSDSIGDGNGSSILLSGEREDEEDESTGTAIGARKSATNGNGGSDAPKLADADDVPDESEAGDDDLSFESDAELRLADDVDESGLDLSEDLHFESDDSLSLGEDSSVASADTPPSELAPPSDSGLSLGLESEGDSSIESLELPEDSDMLAIEDELGSSPDDSTQLQQDEEFILSPSGEMLGDESSDSGSQVIALDDSEAFEDSSELGSMGDSEPISLVEESEGDALAAFADDDLTPVAAAPADQGSLPEAPFSVWNVLSLLLVVIMLSVVGMLMTDVVRNMWTSSGDGSSGGGLASSIVSMLGM